MTEDEKQQLIATFQIQRQMLIRLLNGPMGPAGAPELRRKITAIDTLLDVFRELSHEQSIEDIIAARPDVSAAWIEMHTSLGSGRIIGVEVAESRTSENAIIFPGVLDLREAARRYLDVRLAEEAAYVPPQGNLYARCYLGQETTDPEYTIVVLPLHGNG